MRVGRRVALFTAAPEEMTYIYLHDRWMDRHAGPSKTAGRLSTAGVADTPDGDLEAPRCVTASQRALRGSSHTDFWDALTAVTESAGAEARAAEGDADPSGQHKCPALCLISRADEPVKHGSSNRSRWMGRLLCANYTLIKSI